ncbi:MAG: NAD-dependent protein deacylase [Clostridiales bacterium]|nr:NAD-dependent protein deacylase [Clostridiales bacterium]
MEEELLKLKKAIDESRNIAVLGGAGFSTESGIPDFRSPDGIYTKYRHLSPEAILSAEMLRDKPDVFYDFYLNAMLVGDAMPNIAHKYIAKLEQTAGKHVTVITQNIDGLHQKAGSRNVIELHGSANEYYCVGCGETYGISVMNQSEFTGEPPLPRCIKCGAMIRPDVVMYHEMLDSSRLEKAVKAMREANLVIVGGTSLEVYPANSLLGYSEKAVIFTINRQVVDTGRFAGKNELVFIQGSLGDVFGALSAME